MHLRSAKLSEVRYRPAVNGFFTNSRNGKSFDGYNQWIHSGSTGASIPVSAKGNPGVIGGVLGIAVLIGQVVPQEWRSMWGHRGS